MNWRTRWLVCTVALMGALPACGDDASAEGDTGSESGGDDDSLDASSSAPADSSSDGSSVDDTGTTAVGSESSGAGSSTGDPCDCVPAECPAECIAPLAPEVGFVEIEPVDFTLHAGAQSQDFTSSPARLWYGFQPADEAPDDKPLVVVFNGGPGAASEIMFSFNVSARSFDEDHNGGAAIGPSPASWTSIANLLYIDARTTGFSYNMMDDPSNPQARTAEFDVQNFNPPLDAADFVRVVLRFLAAHPQIRAKPVVLAGESYGGVRATLMLDLLLDYEAHASATVAYQDDALADEIQAHFDAVFPGVAGQSFAPEQIAQQFTHQILVQPLFLGASQLDNAGVLFDQPGSVIFDIAADVGQTFLPCSAQGGGCDPYFNAISFVEGVAGRDRFAYPYAYDWLFGRIDSLAPKFSTVDLSGEFFGVDLTLVDWLYADARTQAYRAPGAAGAPRPPLELAFAGVHPRLLSPGRSFVGGAPLHLDGDYPTTFGALESWDTYYLPSNYIVLDAFYGTTATNYGVDPYAPANAAAFLRNAAYVNTFITNAAYDLVIWGPAIPPTIAQLDTYVAGATHDELGPVGADRPGQVVIDYADGAFGLGPGESRTVRFPFYAEASHTVTLNQPVELLADVTEWLAEP